MGQGTSKYRKIMRTPQTGENAGKKLWYATAVSDREMSFEDFVTHISEHNSPYSRGTSQGGGGTSQGTGGGTDGGGDNVSL